MPATATPSASSPPFGPPHAADGPETLLPPRWDDLPPAVQSLFVLLFRWAHSLDGAPARCTRRKCRTEGFCASGPEDKLPCSGAPGPEVASMVLGMWLARGLDLHYVVPPNEA